MRRKIIVVLLAATLAAVMVIGLTGAWFTVPGFKAVSGTGGTNNVGLSALGSSTALSFSNLEPGGEYVTAGYVHITNTGDYNLKFRGGLFDVKDVKGLKNKVEVKCTMNPTGYGGSYGPPNKVLFDVWLYQLEDWTNGYILCDQTTAAGWPFTPGADIWYKLEVKLDNSAGNTMLDATYSADLWFGGTQWINPGW